jgi:hypothetical protein
MKTLGDKRINVGLDCLKVLAAFTVVLIHAPNPHQVPSWEFALGLLPSPNAIFSLVAGILMSSMFAGTVNLGVWMKKRMFRLVVPYLIWEAIYVMLNLVFDMICQRAITIGHWNRWAMCVFFGAGSIQLWFVAMLFYAQLFVMVIWCNSQAKLSPKAFKFWTLVIGLLLCFSYSLLTADSIHRKFVFVLGYLLVGIALSWVTNSSWMHHKRVGYFLGLGLLLTIIVNMSLKMSPGLEQVVRFFNSILWVLASCALPINLPGERNIMIFASCTMGIYLVHTLFTRMLLLACDYTEPYLGPDLFPITNALIAFALSMCVVLATKRWRFLWGN